jgi:hypothetical protein
MTYQIKNMWSGITGPESDPNKQVARVFFRVGADDGRWQTVWLPITWNTLPFGTQIDLLAVA